MPTCSAVDCNNSAKKGFKMNVFPRDEKRRAQWAAMVHRKNWEPKNTSYLCEVHFERDQWELNRADNKIKLKWNATPTLFSHLKTNTTKRTHSVPNIRTPPEINQTIEIDEKPFLLPNSDIDPLSNIYSYWSVEVVNDSDQAMNNESTIKHLHLQDKLTQYQNLYSKIQATCMSLKRKLRSKTKMIKSIMNSENNNKYLKILRMVFNNDQIQSLCRKSAKGMKWSNATVKKALQIRNSCGVSGYEELLKNKIPLPCTRTLRRRTQYLKNISSENHLSYMADNKINFQFLDLNFDINLNISELNSLYNIAGYILAKIQKFNTHCKNCIQSVGSKKFTNTIYTKLINIKRKPNTLFFVSAESFDVFIRMEAVFRKNYENLCAQNINLLEVFKYILQKHVEFAPILDCHNISENIISRFIKLRLYIVSKKCKKTQLK